MTIFKLFNNNLHVNYQEISSFMILVATQSIYPIGFCYDPIYIYPNWTFNISKSYISIEFVIGSEISCNFCPANYQIQIVFIGYNDTL